MSDGFDNAQAHYDAQQPHDLDDIDGFEFERLNNAIAEATDDLSSCDQEHKAECKADLAKLQDELFDLKAGL